jgi:hypothetical protein
MMGTSSAWIWNGKSVDVSDGFGVGRAGVGVFVDGGDVTETVGVAILGATLVGVAGKKEIQVIGICLAEKD